MTLQPIPSEFLYIWGKFHFLCHQCTLHFQNSCLKFILFILICQIRFKNGTVEKPSLSVIPLFSKNLCIFSLIGALWSAECTARWCSARRRTPRVTTSGSTCPSWRSIPPSTSTPPGRRHFLSRRLPGASSVGHKINQHSAYFIKQKYTSTGTCCGI